MTNAPKYLFLAMTFLVGAGCKKEGDPRSIYDSENIFECHNERKWSFEATKDNIVGLWEWKHAEYIYAVPPADDSALEDLRIEFRDNWSGTLTNKDSTFDFKWSIGTYDVYYGFSTDPAIPQLGGQIFFCGGIMECGVSEFTDGVNNVFKKVE